MFRRRRRERTEASPPEEAAAAVEEDTAVTDSDEAGPGPDGPWDEHDDAPDEQRIDFGGVRIPVRHEAELQMQSSDDRIIGVTIVHEESALQVRVFAAPKSGGIWDDVRREIDQEVTGAGGKVEEVDGPLGVELTGEVPVDVPGQGKIRQPIRFVGHDGPRWLLQGVIQGRAAAEAEAAAAMEELFRGIVVVRGQRPMAPKDLIELRLPPEAQGVLDEQEQEDAGDESIFERGPEITETR